MTGYLIVWSLTLVLVAGFVTYWVTRIERKHRARMAAIDAAAEADAARFEADRCAWDETNVAARNKYAALVAEIRAEIPGSDELGLRPEGTSDTTGEQPAVAAT